ncbi:unnamed protein product [Cyclocybe aegerita]|uniref:Uncharacterized protein n=1 Tax=Cyclocybe aegerita TaxID=1973307 RepID=A0A8S0VZY8_CYCAE|nr:unnamed protein product [Cyclocybe aegerita]
MSDRLFALATFAVSAAEEAARALNGTLPYDFQSTSLNPDGAAPEIQQPQQSIPPKIVSFVVQPEPHDAKDALKLLFFQMDFSTDRTTGDTSARPVKWMLYEKKTPDTHDVWQSAFAPTYLASGLKEKGKASKARRRASTPDIFRPAKLGNYSEKRVSGVAEQLESYGMIQVRGSRDDPVAGTKDAHRAARSGIRSAHRPSHTDHSESEDSTLRHLTAPEVERIRRRSRIPWIDIVCHPEVGQPRRGSDCVGQIILS